jgi:hypothetical protein
MTVLASLALGLSGFFASAQTVPPEEDFGVVRKTVTTSVAYESGGCRTLAEAAKGYFQSD